MSTDAPLDIHRAARAVRDAIAVDTEAYERQAGRDALESLLDEIVRLRSANTEPTCSRCAAHDWPEFQGDPTPTWWHDNQECPLSAQYVAKNVRPWEAASAHPEKA